MGTEKNEKEIKQVNFRIDQASADAFRSFCTANGMNQAQGFDHLIQVLELNQAKAATPGRAVEIENFERLTKDLLAAYLTSLELGNSAEVRVAEHFRADLQRKDRTIDELREKADQAIADQKKLSETLAAAEEEKQRMEANTAHLDQALEAAKKSVQDQEQLNAVLKDQLETLREKAARYEELVQICAAVKSKSEQLEMQQKELSHTLEAETAEKNKYQEQVDQLKTTVRELEAAAAEDKMKLSDLTRKLNEKEADCQNLLKQAKMQADLDLERAVVAKEREMQEEIRKMDRENAGLLAELTHLRALKDTAKADQGDDRS